MAKITMIGAGSVVFASRLITDIIYHRELRESTIALMDINSERLSMINQFARTLAKKFAPSMKIEATLNRKEALMEADYVIVMIQVGGIEAFEKDIYIPLKYGVNQEVGDTIGPGGVFRGLRTIPVLLDICHDMEEVCPDALLINYANPMAINCWAMNRATKIKNVGLCHSVQGTAMQLAKYINVPYEDVSYWVAGLNHEAFFLEFKYNGVDAYPLLWEASKKREIYEKDKVRFEMMKYLGYFITESSHHLGEYLPYFRTSSERIRAYCEPRWFYLQICKESWKPHYERLERQIRGEEPIELSRSHEYGVDIILSMETGAVHRINGNVDNKNLISNLPYGCCVEVPCMVDKNGIHPCNVGDLPPQCAALNRTSINVQELAVKAALERDRNAALQAVMFDPLTSAVLTPREIEKMVKEMFEAEAEWIPF
ncbi:MAG: alpha-glucosidase/alpha-galactosidase [Nitrososphaerota archaeon]|nr:alpha-glucosidase/alpha-galactosidase [Candidatus Bathyarchaeota archaeon]MDW8049227.1 alpha-glucosidase/alpha-galactosidase [Nitrososphaerota archaeon]